MSSSVSLVLLVLLVLCAAAEAQLRVFNLRAANLPSDPLGITDGYVKVFCGEEFLGKTSVHHNNANPWWKEEFTYLKVQKNDLLKLEVYDSDFLADDLVGVCETHVKIGIHDHTCFLDKKSILHYTYTLENY